MAPVCAIATPVARNSHLAKKKDAMLVALPPALRACRLRPILLYVSVALAAVFPQSLLHSRKLRPPQARLRPVMTALPPGLHPFTMLNPRSCSSNSAPTSSRPSRSPRSLPKSCGCKLMRRPLGSRVGASVHALISKGKFRLTSGTSTC